MATSSTSVVSISRKLAGGNTQSLLCCNAPVSVSSIVATSSQDGTLCLFDLRNKDQVHMFDFFGQEAVTSIVSSTVNSDILFASAGTRIYCIDIRVGSLGGEMMQYNFNTEEINQVSLSKKASYIAAADDSGEVKVIDLHNQKLIKTLWGAHTNICSTVQFHPHRPWELMTGGLDAKVVKWDFNKGRPLKIFDQGAGACDGKASGQFCNPPLVHVLAMSETQTPGEGGRLMAIAKGDGAVEICDLELENWKEILPQGLMSKYSKQQKKGKGKEHQQSESLNTADDTIGGHTAAVSCVTFARFSKTSSLLVSGSNDRSIKLWDLSRNSEQSSSTESSTGGSPMILNVHHGKKVNWLCTSGSTSENLFVADTSKILSVYTLQ